MLGLAGIYEDFDLSNVKETWIKTNASINDNIFTANKCRYDLLKYNTGIFNISKSPKAIFEIDNIKSLIHCI